MAKMKREPITLVLMIKVEYDPIATTRDDLVATLLGCADRLAADGCYSEGLDANVDSWEASVMESLDD